MPISNITQMSVVFVGFRAYTCPVFYPTQRYLKGFHSQIPQPKLHRGLGNQVSRWTRLRFSIRRSCITSSLDWPTTAAGWQLIDHPRKCNTEAITFACTDPIVKTRVKKLVCLFNRCPLILFRAGGLNDDTYFRGYPIPCPGYWSCITSSQDWSPVAAEWQLIDHPRKCNEDVANIFQHWVIDIF